MDENDAIQLWAKLGEEGKAPAEVVQASHILPSYTVGFEVWIERIVKRYLRGLCRKAPHFKLVLAPYGGGKTHFLVALGVRALQENYAVAYVPCGEGVSLDKPLAIYQELIKRLQLPGREEPGLRAFLDATVARKRAEIEGYNVPDVDAAFRVWVATIRRGDYPENAFGRVMAAALEAVDDGIESDVGAAAVRWLQGDFETLSRSEMMDLRLARVAAGERVRFGRNLFLSLVKFVQQAGVYGLALLMDEVETLFQVQRGTAARRTLAAMRVFLDVSTEVYGGIPLIGVFSATPDVLQDIRQYPALEQRLAVRGASFDQNNDLATQLHLTNVKGQQDLLSQIGYKLVGVGRVATGVRFDEELQRRNAQKLAYVASERNLDVDARRLFVKTWVGILDLQSRNGEKEFPESELADRYAGSFGSLEELDGEGYEP